MNVVQARPDTAEGPMVTIFGDGLAIDQAIAAEFGRQGSRTHLVTTETGWLASSDLVVARLDTPAGAMAIRDLASHDSSSTRIICMCQDPGSRQTADSIAEACFRCGKLHHLTLLWHPPVASSSTEGTGNERTLGKAGQEVLATELAAVVAREDPAFGQPGFEEHVVGLGDSGQTP